jgi:adenylate cyclase
VLNGSVPASTFRNRIVVVGPSAPSLHDVHATPTSRDELMSGAELQANATWTVVNGYPLKSAPPLLVALLIALFGFLAPVASLRLSFVSTILLPLTVGVAFTVATQLGFEQGMVIPFTYPMAALVLSTVGAVGTHYSVAAFERARTRDVFSRFVPEEVVKQVLARTDRDLRLGGVDVVGTIMFTDLRGFTSFSEQLEAARVIDIVNVYLTEMSEAILAHGGTLVSYAGDGIMAVFGAPIDQPDHADRAVAAGEEMLSVRLPRVNDFVRAQGYGDGFRMGIGVHSGAFIAGNIGSERRLEYTAIGDTVNAASRIEGLTKGTRHMMLFSEATQVLMTSPPTDDLVFFAEHELRGRQAALRLFSLESISDPLPGAATAPVLEPVSPEDDTPPETMPGIAAV